MVCLHTEKQAFIMVNPEGTDQSQQWRLCAVNVLATFVAVAFVDKLGRRMLLIVASVWMFVTQVIVAITLGTEFQKYGAELPRGVSIGMLVVRAGLLSLITDFASMKLDLFALASVACW